MLSPELHIAETAGWRALLTHAQIVGGVCVSPPVEEHMINMLFRHVGAQLSPADLDNDLIDQLEQMITADTANLAMIGDQRPVLAGLFPENAIAKGIPITYFVQLGRNAYRDYSSKHHAKLQALLSDEFVLAMDTLQTVRLLQSGEPCIDGFNAYHLWRELGSSHGWRVLRGMTASLPVSCETSGHVH